MQGVLREVCSDPPCPTALPSQVRSLDDAILSARHVHTSNMVPVFQISSVTGQGVDLLRSFLNLLPRRHRW